MLGPIFEGRKRAAQASFSRAKHEVIFSVPAVVESVQPWALASSEEPLTSAQVPHKNGAGHDLCCALVPTSAHRSSSRKRVRDFSLSRALPGENHEKIPGTK